MTVAFLSASSIALLRSKPVLRSSDSEGDVP